MDEFQEVMTELKLRIEVDLLIDAKKNINSNKTILQTLCQVCQDRFQDEASVKKDCDKFRPWFKFYLNNILKSF